MSKAAKVVVKWVFAVTKYLHCQFIMYIKYGYRPAESDEVQEEMECCVGSCGKDSGTRRMLFAEELRKLDCKQTRM
jgi:hypothetical protein